VSVTAIELIRGAPRGGHLRVQRASEHPPGQGDLRDELDLFGNARGVTPAPIVVHAFGRYTFRLMKAAPLTAE
jgi:hypothetical protein